MLLKEINFFLKCSSINRLCWSSDPGRKDLVVRVLLQGWDITEGLSPVTGLSLSTLRGPPSYRHTGRYLLMVMVFLACPCMTTLPVGVLAELEPVYLVGEQGCVQSKLTPLLSNKQELFCQINSSDFQLEKLMMN